MSDVDQHFQSVKRVRSHAAEQEWLTQAYARLERQTRVFHALELCLGVYYPKGDKTTDAIVKLKLHVARVIVAQCESIMRHSGLADLDDGDPPAGRGLADEEAREETLPW